MNHIFLVLTADCNKENHHRSLNWLLIKMSYEPKRFLKFKNSKYAKLHHQHIAKMILILKHEKVTKNATDY